MFEHSAICVYSTGTSVGVYCCLFRKYIGGDLFAMTRYEEFSV